LLEKFAQASVHVKATVMFEPAVEEPMVKTSRLTVSPATKARFDAVAESVPAADVPAAAIEKVAALAAFLRSAAVKAEPTGAVVTATVAPVMTPSKGILMVTMLLVVKTPGTVNVMVLGASTPVDIFSPMG
jgi:hypothetical protein